MKLNLNHVLINYSILYRPVPDTRSRTMHESYALQLRQSMTTKQGNWESEPSRTPANEFQRKCDLTILCSRPIRGHALCVAALFVATHYAWKLAFCNCSFVQKQITKTVTIWKAKPQHVCYLLPSHLSTESTRKRASDDIFPSHCI